MKVENFNKLLFDFEHLISVGNISEAKEKLSYLTKNLNKNQYINYVYAGLAIDIGVLSSDEKLLDQGILINEELKDKLNKTDILYPDCCYNLANGISEKIKEKLSKVKRYLPGDPLVEKAKTNYREALRLTPDTDKSKPSIYVNYGNLLNSSVGRNFEAFEAYEKALDIDPEFAMALGNKGYIQSLFAHVLDDQTGYVILNDAYTNIKRAATMELDYGAKVYFDNLLDGIRNLFEKPEELDEEIICDKPIKKSRNKFENYYKLFCHKERLYLNPLGKDHQCEAALYDPLRITRFIENINDGGRFYQFADYINIIKQEYVLARLFAVQSFYKDKNIAFVDKGVSLINTLDYQAFNIFLDLAKASFRTSYSILDKVAYVFNDYLNLGYDPNKLHFRHLSQLNAKNNKIREKLSSIKNPFIAAITDLANDFENKHFKEISDIRNAMEHRFRTIHLDYGTSRFDLNQKLTPEEQDRKEQELLKTSDFRTTMLDMLRLAKAAIFYLVLMIDFEERKKLEEIEDGKIAPMIFQEIPDDLKIE